MLQPRERINQEARPEEAGRAPVVFVSASAEDARMLREFTNSRWLVVNVPDLTGARAVIDKLRPGLVVCDTEIEGKGSWREFAAGRDCDPGFVLVVASHNADEALRTEVLHLGGTDVLREPFAWEDIERIIRLGQMHSAV